MSITNKKLHELLDRYEDAAYKAGASPSLVHVREKCAARIEVNKHVMKRYEPGDNARDVPNVPPEAMVIFPERYIANIVSDLRKQPSDHMIRELADELEDGVVDKFTAPLTAPLTASHSVTLDDVSSVIAAAAEALKHLSVR